MTIGSPRLSLVDLVTARNEKLRREGIQRLARRFTLEAARMTVPSGVAGAVVRVDGELHFMADPSLDDVDLKLSAIACATRSEQLSADSDDSDGIGFALLEELRRECARAPRGLGRFVDEVLLGIDPTVRT